MQNQDNNLLGLLGDGDFHSGEELGKILRVSRTAVWKQVRKYRQKGLEIDSISGRGYRIAGGVTLLNRESIRHQLSPSANRHLSLVDLFLSIDSTNSEAMRRIQAGASGRSLIIAEQQSQGRGRRGRQWMSPMARNIYMSIIWPFDGGVKSLEGLSLVTALSLVRALRSLGLPGLDALQVKWPNDVWLGGKKLAGILLELQGDVQGPLQVVIGIGLNVSMPDDVLSVISQPVTDLSKACGMKLDRNTIVSRIVSQLDQDLELFSIQGFSPFRVLWQELDIFNGQPVEVTLGNSRITGVVSGVDLSGALLLSTRQGSQRITGGEVYPSVRAASEGIS